MVCTTDIVPVLMQMKYDDHELLALEDITKEPYVPMVAVGGIPIERIPQDWAHRLNKAGLLGLINMPHFGWLNEVNACVKQLSAYFHGGMLWLDTLVEITVDLILDITGLPKYGPDPPVF